MQEGATSISTEPGDLARQKLREAIALYGRSAFQEPRRCEAILRDCCPTAPREVFLLVSALRENVAEELVRHDGNTPEAALVARLTRRLSDHLGLTDDSARWAVDSWRYGLEDNPGLRANVEGIRFASQDPGPPGRGVSVMNRGSAGGAVNWPWLVMCLIAIASAAAALAAMVSITWFDPWTTWQRGLMECGGLALALAGAGFGEMLSERSFAQIAPPDYGALDPRKAPYALLPEVVILLALPLVAVAVPAMCAMKWWSQLHLAGLPHDAAFYVILCLETVWVAAFLYYWIRGMPGIQSRIACSMVQR